MAFLHFLEGLRNPFFDTFFLIVTQFGESTVMIIVATALLWCVDKKWGYSLIYIGALGMSVNLLLKHIFAVPRPWVRDPSLTLVQGAREAATGYSFPSGHTQNGTTTFGGLARLTSGRLVRGLLIAVAGLVAFSRMYLGVHTPQDVLVSLLIGAALVLCLPLFFRLDDNAKRRHALRLALPLFSLVIVLFMRFSPLADATSLSAAGGMKNAYTGLGVSVGLTLIRYIDEKRLSYTTDCVYWAQLLKLLLGLVFVYGVQFFLKASLERLFGGNDFIYAVRYALVVLAAGAVWPLTFRFWSRLGNTDPAGKKNTLA